MEDEFKLADDDRVAQGSPNGGSLVTRRYPVDLPLLQEKLHKDLKQGFDVVLHMGQSPGASSIKLEAIALNAAGCLEDRGDELDEIIPGGPLAYRSNMPLSRWASLLRSHQIPTIVSYHAGTFLCNAVMYLSHHALMPATGKKQTSKKRQDPCRVGFVHLRSPQNKWLHTGNRCLVAAQRLSRAMRLLLDDLQNEENQVEHVA